MHFARYEERSLGRIQALERAIAVFCLLIPPLLWLADDGDQLRDSISDYAYMRHSFYYGMVVTIAGMMFLTNGILYFDRASVDKSIYSLQYGRWYNVILGVSLFGVILFPYKEYYWLHFTAATIFFIGSSLSIAIFSEKKHRTISLAIAGLSILSFVIHFTEFIPLSLLWAEWIALSVIAIHYSLESRGLLTAA